MPHTQLISAAQVCIRNASHGADMLKLVIAESAQLMAVTKKSKTCSIYWFGTSSGDGFTQRCAALKAEQCAIYPALLDRHLYSRMMQC